MKTIAWLMSFDFCRIWKVGSEVCVMWIKVGGIIVLWIFSCNTLGSLVSTEHYLDDINYLSIVDDHVYPFMTTVHQIAIRYF